jgi:hypothetical protein
MKHNLPRFQLTLKLHLLPLGVGYEMDLQKGYNMKAPGDLNIPLGPFLNCAFFAKSTARFLPKIPSQTARPFAFRKEEVLWMAA